MKKIISISSLRWLVCLFMTSMLVTSCSSDEDDWERPDDMTPYVPDYSIAFTGFRTTSWSASGGTAVFDLKLYIRADFDYWQLQMVSISYYIDNKYVLTATEEPYSFVYTATGLTRGTHKLVGRTRIKDLVNDKEIIINPSMEFEIK